MFYTAALGLIAGLGLGIASALHATGMRIQDALRADSRTATTSRRAVAARSVLVAGQLALSVILLVGALLLVRSYQRLQQVDLGVEVDRVLPFDLFVPPARQRDPDAARRTLAAVADRLASTPGVEIAGAATGELGFAGQDAVNVADQ